MKYNIQVKFPGEGWRQSYAAHTEDLPNKSAATKRMKELCRHTRKGSFASRSWRLFNIDLNRFVRDSVLNYVRPNDCVCRT